jgi:glycosyltransferase involved in cell wall biosynthesis
VVKQKSNDRPKIIVAIPTYNEERFIGSIVTRAKKYADKVIVVDDGSTDNTSEVARAAGAEVIKHKTNQGAGAATKTAFLASSNPISARCQNTANSALMSSPFSTTSAQR